MSAPTPTLEPGSGQLDVHRIRAVIFDMDDTLLNWRKAELGAIGDLARIHFAPLGIQEVEVRAHYDAVMAANYLSWKATRTWWYIADRLKMLVDRLEITDKVTVAELATTFSREVTARLDWLGGAQEALRFVRASGRKSAVLTNGRSEIQRPKVHAFGLEHEVDFVGITGELGAWKPDPEAFHLVLAPLGMKPHEVLMVGDNFDFDILPAKQLGMQTAWINATRERHAWADITIAVPGELIAHLTPGPDSTT